MKLYYKTQLKLFQSAQFFVYISKKVKGLLLIFSSEDFLCRYDFDVILVFFCSYGYGTNAFEAV